MGQQSWFIGSLLTPYIFVYSLFCSAAGGGPPQSLTKLPQSLPKHPQSIPEASQSIPKASQKLSKAFPKLPQITPSLQSQKNLKKANIPTGRHPQKSEH